MSRREDEGREVLNPSRKLQLARTTSARTPDRIEVAMPAAQAWGFVFAAIHTHRLRFKLDSSDRSV
ncbi:MAG: hypothetical protein IIB57_09145 [Planctomycetes bacterium]|nr:hypothetical protein [Planctomycetota bacterium]